MKLEYGQVVMVDNGNFFPEDDLHQDAAWFLMDIMKLLDIKAVGMSAAELRFGYAFLKANVKRTSLPLTSANLMDVGTGKPALVPYVISKVGNVKVAFFSLMNDKEDLGPGRDSLKVQEPTKVAQAMVPDLRKKGATVVVLLSQLGKVESEDLVTAVPGIDAVICGHNVPLIQKGRMIKNTVASYGGEQGQYMSRTILTLDKTGHVTTGDNESFILSPEVGENADIAKLVKTFEDGMNEKLRKAEKEAAAKQGQAVQANADHYLGYELCARCHKSEYEQWRTTSHSIAWNTLVAVKQDASTECISCHVVGYKENGGYQTAADSPRLSGVQCESCHGMGTRHESYPKSPAKFAEAVCTKCHVSPQDPDWNFAVKLAKVVHGNTSAETIKGKKQKDAIPADRLQMLQGHGGGY
ncbi:MAG: multiheme c-type cytochrome [Candidatus Eisenbacteria bacterium]